MEFLLDTDTCIFIIKQKPVQAIQKFQSLPFGSVGISSITLAELQFGVANSSDIQKNQNALNYFISPLEIIEFDQSAAIAYGRIRSSLEIRGMKIGPLDNLIAAHALSRDVVLVTNNTKEFSRVEGLKIENWI